MTEWRSANRWVSGRWGRIAAVAIVISGGLLGVGVVPPTPVAAAVPQPFVTYTDPGEHVFTVPWWVKDLEVDAAGGKGGSGYAPGGAGAKLTADVKVSPGQTLYVEVGSDGAPASLTPTAPNGGANGGGVGGTYFSSAFTVAGSVPFTGAGGGGASDIQLCPIASCKYLQTPRSSLLLVAAGGGGAGGYSAGGAGGTPNGQNGAKTIAESGIGTGATTTAPGSESVLTNGPLDGSTILSEHGWDGASYGGGGGGGGYFGGGGGMGGEESPAVFGSASSGNELASGGGGGSSYGPPGTYYETTTDPASITISYMPAYAVHLVPAKSTSLLVDISGSSTAEGARVVQGPATGSLSQNWIFVPEGDNYEIANLNTGMCLTSDGNPGHTVYQSWCNQTGSQLWKITSNFGPNTPSPIQNAATGLYLEVYGGSTDAGGNIDTWPWNGGNSNQMFYATVV